MHISVLCFYLSRLLLKNLNGYNKFLVPIHFYEQ